MSRARRDLQSERTAIEAAAARLLSGTPLRSSTGRLSATELITEAGLPRWKVYEHRDLVEHFQAQVQAETMRDLAADYERLVTELAQTAAALKDEQARTALLRRALTEASIELEQARQALPANVRAFRLPATRRTAGTSTGTHAQ
jgi:hypothetical protein